MARGFYRLEHTWFTLAGTMSMNEPQSGCSSAQPPHMPQNPLESPQSNACFGCGPSNVCGLQLRFYVDDSRPGVALCKATIPRTFEGPPGHLHGGIIASILDEAMGKVNKLNGVVAMTRTMDIQFLKPVRLETEIHIEGWNERREGRKNFNAGVIRNSRGETLASATGLFLAIDAQKARALLETR